MSAFEVLAALVTVAAGFAYVNHRWLRQPSSIALMAMTLGTSLVFLVLGKAGLVDLEPVARIVDRIAFDDTLLNGMLGALLFAGSLHVGIDDLREHRLAVGTLALVGTLLSTGIVGALTFGALRAIGFATPFSVCLLFGAIVSPTDPVAVLGILNQARVPKAMEVQITGESLFNDGVGVVVFTTVLAIVVSGGAGPGSVVALFLRQAVGGLVFGIVAGYVVYRLVRSIDHYQTELLLTLALVTGGYALARHMQVSAPIAAVVEGLIIGNHGRTRAMSEVTRDQLDKFWALADDVLNALLFVLMGLESIRLTFSRETALAGVIAIPLVLAARWASVAAPLAVVGRRTKFARGTVLILTWGGLRGGISIALALSMRAGPARALLATMTYFVVAFSILVQGLTLGRLARRFSDA